MAPTYTKIIPSLPVSSIPDAIEYYTTVLGFRLAGRDGDNHCWIQLVDDESVDKWAAPVNVYLRKRGFSNISNDVQFGKITIRISGEADELETLAGKLKGQNAMIKRDIAAMPWGTKDLSVVDHDGNIIMFTQMIDGFKMPENTIYMPKKPE